MENSKYKYIEMNENGEIGEIASIRLDGTFGAEIDGARVAHAISYLDNIKKVKEIHLYINTVGGTVFDSLSVVSAMLNANAEIHTHNEGLCMSAGFHVFLSGDVLHAYDYSVFMYHEASFIGIDDKDLSKADRESLESTNEAMSTLIANRTGKEKEEAREMLKDESYFIATKFKEKVGIDIDIKSSKKQPTLKSSMSAKELVAEFKSFNINSKIEEMPEVKELEIKTIMAKLEISADVANPIEAINAKLTALNTVAEKSAKAVAGLTSELEVFKTAEAVAFVEGLIESEKIKAESKDEMVKNYIANAEFVKSTFEAMPEPKASGTIVDGSQERKDEGDGRDLKIEMTKGDNPVAMDYDWYNKNASDKLQKMMSEDREFYNFLFEEYTK